MSRRASAEVENYIVEYVETPSNRKLVTLSMPGTTYVLTREQAELIAARLQKAAHHIELDKPVTHFFEAGTRGVCNRSIRFRDGVTRFPDSVTCPACRAFLEQE